MPVVLKYNQEETTIVLWKIEEEEAFFKSKIEFTEFDRAELNTISHKAKRLEWLASRYLIRFIMDKPGIIHLNKKANGKPVIDNYDEFVSITHTEGYAAVIHSATKQVSIDAEYIDDAVARIKHKFLSPKELEFTAKSNQIEELIAYWSIKETIYKLLEIPGLSFSKEIHISPLDIGEDGVAEINVTHPLCQKTFLVQVKKVGNIFLTWCGYAQ
jgi:4'-phosphopantetheinyl transferase